MLEPQPITPALMTRQKQRPWFKLPALVAAASIFAGCGTTSNLAWAPNSTPAEARPAPKWEVTHSAVAGCPGDRGRGLARCDVLIENGNFNATVSGWTPADFQAAYNLPSSRKGSGQTVAVVAAYDNPNVAADLAAYRSTFKLGKAHFKKYNEKGQQSNYPKGNTGWGVEIDLDVEMISATCPKCTIYLIEANSEDIQDMQIAEKEVAKLGAHVITNSWGLKGSNPSGGAFDVSGVTYLASSGDGGYGMQDPADYQTVVSVGGTVLSKTSSGYSETVWGDTGGGCSDVSKPSWQNDPGCARRTGNDVSAVAKGVAEYDTYSRPGWIVVDGTSVSSPLLAGVFGLAGNGAAHQSGKFFWTLKKRRRKGALHYISVGNDGCPGSIDGSYLCTAGTGQFGTYSGPAGWGTPNGLAAF
jgi:subtilase family serine protease